MSEFTVPQHLPEWIQEHTQRYLESGGEDGHLWDSRPQGGPGLVPTLLLVTTGRLSGKPITLPLIYGENNGAYVIVASRGGSRNNPGWFLNLIEHPEVWVQVASKRCRATARVTKGEERAVLWKQMVEIFPPYETYQRRTEREIPVVVLEPADR